MLPVIPPTRYVAQCLLGCALLLHSSLLPVTPPRAAAHSGPNTLSAAERRQGWRLRFNGKTAAGWRSAKEATFPTHGWQIAKRELTTLAADGRESANGGDITTTAQYRAFDFSFEFQLTSGANRGVIYFVTLA
jgi:hypothetical protein